MTSIEEKFAKLGMENAPGQEINQEVKDLDLRGQRLEGPLVDFSHGDVDAHEPIPGSLESFMAGYKRGGSQAYTEYKGAKSTRLDLAEKLSAYTQSHIDPDNLILTPGTQGALFLAMGSCVTVGTKVAIVEPDYFANRKLVEFFGGDLIGVDMDYHKDHTKAGLDLQALDQAFKDGAQVFLFSNPNNPVGVIYSDDEINKIVDLANDYGVTLIVDELYARQVYDGRAYFHVHNKDLDPEKIITIIGPSKTESMSGFRLGVAYGSSTLVGRMEQLIGIMSLRAPGYCQAVFERWFDEPQGWIDQRIKDHQEIRDKLVGKFYQVDGVKIRPTEAGSYIFPKLPDLDVDLNEFVKILREHANVIVTPGTEFGPGFTDSIRLNFSQDKDKAVAAVDRIIEMIERYRK